MSDAPRIDLPRADLPVRFFCLVLPGGRESAGFDYLQAIDQSGLGVLACPIGQAFFTREPWASIYKLFQGTNAKHFVNIVVAPPNFLMGTRIRASDVKAPPRLPGPGEETLPFAMSAPAAPGPSETVYEPSTALSGLYTVGVPNIAITTPRPKPPVDHEIRALAQYDAIIAPTSGDAVGLCDLGVNALYVPPEPALLKKILERLLGN